MRQAATRGEGTRGWLLLHDCYVVVDKQSSPLSAGPQEAGTTGMTAVKGPLLAARLLRASNVSQRRHSVTSLPLYDHDEKD